MSVWQYLISDVELCKNCFWKLKPWVKVILKSLHGPGARPFTWLNDRAFYIYISFQLLGKAFKGCQPLPCDKLGNDRSSGSDSCSNQYCYPK